VLTRALLRATIVLATILVLACSDEGAALAATPPAGTPTATTFSGVPYVGALFRHGLTKPHGCSASVVRSARRNIVLTAAHCVYGTGAGLRFAPGYVDGRTPYGVWTVTRTWVATPWKVTRDQHYDYAFLEVATAKNGKRVQDVTGGAVLGGAPSAGDTVRGVAYQHGIKDRPVQCTNKIVYTGDYPTFNCHGYVGGVSGSPLLVSHPNAPPMVVGLIGGLRQGGCYEWNSFSSPFRSRIKGTFQRASNGSFSDRVPSAGSSGC